MPYFIEKDSCVDCGYCELLCRFGAIAETENHIYQIDETVCKSCGECFGGCPNRAINPREGTKFIKTVTINKDKCKGCSLCSRKCPVEAISGVVKSPFEIHADRCIKCSTCKEVCKFDAVEILYE